MTELKIDTTEGTTARSYAMLREIYEQPEALAATIEHYVPGGRLHARESSSQLRRLSAGGSGS